MKKFRNVKKAFILISLFQNLLSKHYVLCHVKDKNFKKSKKERLIVRHGVIASLAFLEGKIVWGRKSSSMRYS